MSDLGSSNVRTVEGTAAKRQCLADSQPSSLTPKFSGSSSIETDNNNEILDIPPQDESTSATPNNENPAQILMFAAPVESPSDFTPPSVTPSPELPFDVTMRSVTPPGNGSSDVAVISNGHLPAIVGTASPKLVRKFVSTLDSRLPAPWVTVADTSGIHVIDLSLAKKKVIQKKILISFDYEEHILVLSKPVPWAKKLLSSVLPAPVKLQENTVELLCDRICNIVKAVTQCKVCPGLDANYRKELHYLMRFSILESFLFMDDPEDEAYRPRECQLLIDCANDTRCWSCSNILHGIREKEPSSSSLRKRKLEEDEPMEKIEEEVRSILLQQGVCIEMDLHEDFLSILQDATLSPILKVILEEQVKSSSWLSRHYSWHPVMVRLAIFTHMSCPAARQNLDVLKLPSSRSLYDFTSTVSAAGDAVPVGLLPLLTTEAMCREPVDRFVALFPDNVIICENLVYRDSDNHLLGFIDTKEIAEDVEALERCVLGEEERKSFSWKPAFAFTIKFILSDLKCAVAIYPFPIVHSEVLYTKTWEVISRLQKAGLNVLTVVTPGSKIGHDFIDIHGPITKTLSNVVFDTHNHWTDHPLVFITNIHDICRDIHACFRSGCLEIDGEKLMWSIVTRIYCQYNECNITLNKDPIPCCRNHLAALLFDKKVASDIERMELPDTKQVVKFIRMVGRFLDCFNGVSSIDRSLENVDFTPYIDQYDSRLNWLSTECLRFFEFWRHQVDTLPIPVKEREGKKLSVVAHRGIAIAIMGFVRVCKYLFTEAETQGDRKILIDPRVFLPDE